MFLPWSRLGSHDSSYDSEKYLPYTLFWKFPCLSLLWTLGMKQVICSDTKKKQSYIRKQVIYSVFIPLRPTIPVTQFYVTFLVALLIHRCVYVNHNYWCLQIIGIDKSIKLKNKILFIHLQFVVGILAELSMWTWNYPTQKCLKVPITCPRMSIGVSYSAGVY